MLIRANLWPTFFEKSFIILFLSEVEVLLFEIWILKFEFFYYFLLL